MNHFTGLMAAPFTPFDAKGELRLETIPAYVEKMIADGLKGIFVCGSNGEGPNMMMEERMEVAKAFKDAVGSRIKVYVHVGHTSIRESQKLAAHAAEIGADAISSVAAFYFKPGSVKNLVDALAEIASAAPQLPFYYYNIPHLTGMNMDMTEVLKLGEKSIPNLKGIKYTAATIWEYQLCLNYAQGKYDILFGFDEMLLPALTVGAKGAIGSTYTFAAPLYLQVMKSFEKGDMEDARSKMFYLVEMVKILLKFPPIPAQKAIVKRLGIDLGPCRLPLSNLTKEDEQSLIKQLDDLGFFKKLETLPHAVNDKQKVAL
ncbi:dihydrodipicolinate synthase family protein [Fulvivirgaceae bacterium PWU4]|uniref:Dihydrodipicolinate synthase family protein n=1 Tax=Chryseosolibacter histidini TaxID=2782349 RepID=A0AAP2DKL0_9BACT|nr:dihydrodipicolinate synthase family protein [Chryseosolibacter histidini]MBT1698118.1 dihydrodipicolinate synthase family protein [Chryseosolibacter histidini]